MDDMRQTERKGSGAVREPPGLAWYVLYVVAGKELAVRDAIRVQGYDACVPREEVLERRRGFWHLRERVIFSGYVFVGLTELTTQAYYAIRPLDGVIRFLGTPPEAITPKEERYLRLLGLGEEGLKLSDARADDTGRLHFTAGPLARLQDNVVKVKPRQRRARVGISFLGDTTQFDLSFNIIPSDSTR